MYERMQIQTEKETKWVTEHTAYLYTWMDIAYLSNSSASFLY